jgi:hypothetical protein
MDKREVRWRARPLPFRLRLGSCSVRTGIRIGGQKIVQIAGPSIAIGGTIASVIYSQWRPDRGGYAYYEAAEERRGLGDDLPVPRLPLGTEIGVPSTEAGRSIPNGARHVGGGLEARGVIAPMGRASLGSLLSVIIGGVTMLALGIGIGWWLWRR